MSSNFNLSLSNYLAKLTLRMITFQTRSGIRFATPNALAQNLPFGAVILDLYKQSRIINLRQLPSPTPRAADVFVCNHSSIKQPELIMPKRAHQVFRQQNNPKTASFRKTGASLDIYQRRRDLVNQINTLARQLQICA